MAPRCSKRKQNVQSCQITVDRALWQIHFGFQYFSFMRASGSALKSPHSNQFYKTKVFLFISVHILISCVELQSLNSPFYTVKRLFPQALMWWFWKIYYLKARSCPCSCVSAPLSLQMLNFNVSISSCEYSGPACCDRVRADASSVSLSEPVTVDGNGVCVCVCVHHSTLCSWQIVFYQQYLARKAKVYTSCNPRRVCFSASIDKRALHCLKRKCFVDIKMKWRHYWRAAVMLKGWW